MKIGLFGHSLGGLIAGCYAATYQNLDFLILSNPLLERRKIFNIFYCLPYKALGFIKFKKRRSESKAMLDYSRKDPLSCKRLTLRLAGEILITGINYLFKRLQQIKTPLLVLVGSEDPLIKTQDYPKLIQSFGSQDKTLKIYQGIKHRLVQSPQKEEVINDISNWVNKKIK